MIDSAGIFAQVEREQVPDTWHVFRARRAAHLLLGILSGLVALALLWIALYVVTALLPASPISIGTLLATGTLGITIAVTLIIAVVVGCLVAISAARRVAFSMLVVTPDGLVQRIATARTPVKAIAYADIADMKVSTRSAANTTKVFTSIEMHYADGRTETWIPFPGPADEISQHVIAGHAQYVALHNPQVVEQEEAIIDDTEPVASDSIAPDNAS